MNFIKFTFTILKLRIKTVYEASSKNVKHNNIYREFLLILDFFFKISYYINPSGKLSHKILSMFKL